MIIVTAIIILCLFFYLGLGLRHWLAHNIDIQTLLKKKLHKSFIQEELIEKLKI